MRHLGAFAAGGHELNCGNQRSMLRAAARRRIYLRQHQTPRACQPCGLQIARLGIDTLR
jgi:hypothetical protein